MKIAIDISQIIYGTGVSQYTECLVENLLKIDKSNDYILFGGSLRRVGELNGFISRFRGLGDSQRINSKIFPIPPSLADLIWNRLHIFPIEKLTGKIDVFHSSDWTQPPSSSFKVTTVHDLIPLKFPKMIHPSIVKVYSRRLYWVKREVDRIIVPSNSTKRDLIDCGMDENKIRVIPEANVISKSSEDEVKKIKSKYDVSSDYLLAFGSAPYKNIQNIIRAFELSSSGKNLKLIIVGRQSVGKVKQNRNIRLTGFVENKKLSALFTGAKALVFPSLYEGFGQPILEAFACGVPVVTSNISSMAEVAGGAAELVDPYDVSSISEGIEKVLRGPKSFIEKGLIRVKDFSWTKTAEETLKVYNESKLYL